MEINANAKEFDCMVIFAVRYALGRSSVAPMLVIDFINNNKENISDCAMQTIIEDIQTSENTASLGMEYDKSLWLEFKNELINYRRHFSDE